MKGLLAIVAVKGMRTKKSENFTSKRPICFIIFDISFQIYPTWKLIMGESYKTLL